jgi:hypothetical protein
MTSQRSFADFTAAVSARLEKGRQTYRDESFRRPPGERVGEIAEEILDVCAWSFILWARIRDLEQRHAERIAGAYLLPQLQQDRHQDPRGDPQDRPDGHGSSRIVGLEEAADGAHSENRDSEHHGHHHTEGEPDGLRIEVLQSRSLWPVRGGGAT